jgi:UDP-N-acetylmuramate--alanine ligase
MSQYLVAEGDESDRSFLKLSPIVSVVTNIDREHMDTYRDMEDIEQTFLDFMDRVPFYGTVVVCNDDEPLRNLIPNVQRRVVTYGMREDSDFRILDVDAAAKNGAPGSRFKVEYRGQSLGEFHLHVPGIHNVLNATAAVAVGVGLEIGVEKVRAALDSFRGVDRRFQLRGQVNGISVIDDYGHHPTEIKATLSAARHCGYERIHVIFQPHRYTRTQALLKEFGTAFSDADSVLVLDIYPASEQPIPGVTAEAVVGEIGKVRNSSAQHVGSFADAVSAIVAIARPGDAILTLGAGSVSQLGPQVLEALKSANQVTTA